jgi:hypothetical protein
VAQFEHSPHATVVGDDLFVFIAEHEIRTAMRMRYPISLLAVQLQVQGAAQARIPGDVIDRLGASLSLILRQTDLIRRSPDTPALHVLLVGAPFDCLPGIIQRLATEAEGQRFVVDGNETAITVVVGGACFPTSARTANELVTRADVLAEEARRDDRAGARYRLR